MTLRLLPARGDNYRSSRMSRTGRFSRVDEDDPPAPDRYSTSTFPISWLFNEASAAPTHAGLAEEDTKAQEMETDAIEDTKDDGDKVVVAPGNAKPAGQRPLVVKDVDYNIFVNALDHRTNEYDIAEPRWDGGVRQCVVRRGQSFTLKLTLDRRYDPEVDDLVLVLEIGKKPIVSKGTQVVLSVTSGCHKRKWGCQIQSSSDETEEGAPWLQLELLTPPDAIVGKWHFTVHGRLAAEKGEAKRRVEEYRHPEGLYLLFNPWCKEDQVYLDDEDLRDEYVLNDTGKIYVGNDMQLFGKPWNFGQFEDFMLDCALLLLDRAGLNYKVRGSATHICRAISAIVNSPDDAGVLVGNWSGDYSGGEAPTKWVGSVAILEQYWQTKEPVQYGQCWVFSGLVTSVCRTLGIPARSVTNFSSAHDCDGSLTIDKHWRTDGRPLEAMNDDSIWNFHVWNEAWMSRPDLLTGFGGWQAFDATPQETSEGMYRAGPASVAAIKQGLVSQPYDAGFIFAEVNADKCQWLQQEDGSWKTQFQKNQVGKRISTHRPRNCRPGERNPLDNRDLLYNFRECEHRLDITGNYKFKEGSEEERAAVYRANSCSSRPNIYDRKDEDVKFELVPKDHVIVGSAFDVVISCQNKSREERNISVCITLDAVYYTGVRRSTVKKFTCGVKLQPIKTEEVLLRVTPEEYLDPRHVVDGVCFKISTLATVAETRQVHAGDDNFRLRRPDPELKVPSSVKVGVPFTVEMKFANSMPTSMSNCYWVVEGAGIQREKKIKQRDLEPYEKCDHQVELTARKPGKRKILCSFNSDNLRDLTTEADIEVTE